MAEQQTPEQVARAVAQKYFDDVATVAALEVVDALRAAGLLVQPGQVEYGNDASGRVVPHLWASGERRTRTTHQRFVGPWFSVSGDGDE